MGSEIDNPTIYKTNAIEEISDCLARNESEGLEASWEGSSHEL